MGCGLWDHRGSGWGETVWGTDINSLQGSLELKHNSHSTQAPKGFLSEVNILFHTLLKRLTHSLLPCFSLYATISSPTNIIMFFFFYGSIPENSVWI